MHNFEQGFLSEPFEDVRTAVRTKYAPWHALLQQVNGLSVDTQHSLEIDRHALSHVLGAVLYGRTLASTQAAVLLLEHGLVSQARCLLRSSLETLFTLGAIAKKAALASEVLESHEADRRTIADRMKRWKDPELRKRVDANISEEKLDELLASKAKPLNNFFMAQEAGMEDWYLGLYSILSFPAHNAISDLVRHIVRNSDGEIEALKNEPELDEQESTWAYAIEIQIKAASMLSDIFGSIPFDVQQQENTLRALSMISMGANNSFKADGPDGPRP